MKPISRIAALLTGMASILLLCACARTQVDTSRVSITLENLEATQNAFGYGLKFDGKVQNNDTLTIHDLSDVALEVTYTYLNQYDEPETNTVNVEGVTSFYEDWTTLLGNRSASIPRVDPGQGRKFTGKTQLITGDNITRIDSVRVSSYKATSLEALQGAEPSVRYPSDAEYKVLLALPTSTGSALMDPASGFGGTLQNKTDEYWSSVTAECLGMTVDGKKFYFDVSFPATAPHSTREVSAVSPKILNDSSLPIRYELLQLKVEVDQTR